jgi:hypothetical protein
MGASHGNMGETITDGVNEMKNITVTMTNNPTDSANNLTQYWATYNDQFGVENYMPQTFLDDALYGIGIAMSDEYRFAEGFLQFKKDLLEQLKRDLKDGVE